MNKCIIHNDPCANCIVLPLCIGKRNRVLLMKCKQLYKYIMKETDIFNPDLKPNKTVKYTTGSEAKEDHPVIEIFYHINSLKRTIRVTRYPDQEQTGVMRAFYHDDIEPFYTVFERIKK